ncbi:hypothetical protein ruthe_02199 [Rubellimicrobium thermophilum DSM 16684]|uniref:Uncharacterized protein n=1 Tax=Rubellimicrobium thermophilum DSM 16684 TaxID=1123069 RepID=S9QSL9_9RHOB|nr:hypothetical protein ruthe_02199 [Rubellimicrobium thermophilum DSM 16684]
MPDLPPARSVRRAPLGGEPHGHVVLRHEERLLRRRRLVTTGGRDSWSICLRPPMSGRGMPSCSRMGG